MGCFGKSGKNKEELENKVQKKRDRAEAKSRKTTSKLPKPSGFEPHGYSRIVKWKIGTKTGWLVCRLSRQYW